MKKIIDSANGIWYELETSEDGKEAAIKTRTAIGHYFEFELQGRSKPNHVKNSYYVLVAPDGGIPACVAIGSEGSKFSKPLSTGHSNSNPFDEFEDDFSILSEFIGMEITKDSYPYNHVTPSFKSLKV